MKRVIWLIMSVITLVVIGLVVYQSDLNTFLPRTNTSTVQSTPTVAPAIPDSQALIEHRDQYMSFSYPSNWQASTEFCDALSCYTLFSLEERVEKLGLYINESIDPETQQPYNSVEEYLAAFYPDKAIISSTQSIDDKVTLHTVEGLDTEVWFQLPTSKKIVSLVFQDTDESKDSILQSLQILE